MGEKDNIQPDRGFSERGRRLISSEPSRESRISSETRVPIDWQELLMASFYDLKSALLDVLDGETDKIGIRALAGEEMSDEARQRVKNIHDRLEVATGLVEAFLKDPATCPIIYPTSAALPPTWRYYPKLLTPDDAQWEIVPEEIPIQVELISAILDPEVIKSPGDIKKLRLPEDPDKARTQVAIFFQQLTPESASQVEDLVGRIMTGIEKAPFRFGPEIASQWIGFLYSVLRNGYTFPSGQKLNGFCIIPDGSMELTVRAVYYDNRDRKVQVDNLVGAEIFVPPYPQINIRYTCDVLGIKSVSPIETPQNLWFLVEEDKDRLEQLLDKIYRGLSLSITKSGRSGRY